MSHYYPEVMSALAISFIVRGNVTNQKNCLSKAHIAGTKQGTVGQGRRAVCPDARQKHSSRRNLRVHCAACGPSHGRPPATRTWGAALCAGTCRYRHRRSPIISQPFRLVKVNGNQILSEEFTNDDSVESLFFRHAHLSLRNEFRAKRVFAQARFR